MIIAYDSVFGYVNIIVFQLIKWIIVNSTQSWKVVLGYCENMLGFSYLAIPTRHTVQIKPCLQDIRV